MAAMDGFDEGPGQEDRHWALPCRRVLVVDADEGLAEAQAILLETLGQDVRCAHEGDSALRVAITFRPQLVLLSLDLPAMDGLELAKRLRILRPTRGARLVAQVTGPTTPRTPPGFDGWISKSASLATLITELRATVVPDAVPPILVAPLRGPLPAARAEPDLINCAIRD